MLMVIHGAGASFDSVHPANTALGREEAPPLAKDLFALRFKDAVAGFPPCADLVGRLRLKMERGVGVEDAIDQELSQAAAGYPELFGGLLALRFYLKRIIAESTERWAAAAASVTNYLGLLRHIEFWRRPRDEAVLLVTFNYDILLENAAMGVLNLGIESIDSYTERDDYRIYKPHGSVNWLHQTFLPASEGSVASLVSRAEEVTQDLAMAVTEARDPIRFDDGIGTGRATVPALAVPIRIKRNFVCPAQHLHDLQQQMEHVDRLLTIGWQAQEAHFLKIMEERLDPHVLCTIVNGPHGGIEVQERLRRETRLTRFTPDQRVGFSDLVSKFDEVLADLLG